MPPWHQNPYFANALICSTTVQSVAPGDSATVTVSWNVPPHVPWLNSSALGVCIQTANDPIGPSGHVGYENNLAQNTWRHIYLSAGGPPRAMPPGSAPQDDGLPATVVSVSDSYSKLAGNVDGSARETATAQFAGVASSLSPPARALVRQSRGTVPRKPELAEGRGEARGAMTALARDSSQPADPSRPADPPRSNLLDPPPLPLTTTVPLNNPFEEERAFMIDIEAELPPDWDVEIFSLEFGPLLPPAMVVLPPLHETPLEVTIVPGPGATHGETASVTLLDYIFDLYPTSEGLIGAVSLPTKVDVREPMQVAFGAAEVVEQGPCVPPIYRVRLEWEPVQWDVSGLPEEIAYYEVFRDTTDIGTPVPDNLVARVTTDGMPGGGVWEWIDLDAPVRSTGPDIVYWVVAVDKGFNASEPSEPIVVPIARDYTDHDVGTVRMTMTDQGILGVMEEGGRGNGFIYPIGGENSLYLSSFWVGTEPFEVANRDYEGEPTPEWQRSDEPDGHIVVTQPGASDQDIQAAFRDKGSPAPRWLVEQTSYAWADPTTSDFVVVEYRLHNDSGVPQLGILAGLFADWDLEDYTQNEGAVDLGLQLGYMTSVTGASYRGVALLPTHPMRNGSLIHNPTYIWPGNHIPDEEKFFFLEGTDPAHQQHTSYEVSDWSAVVSAGPFDLGAGESVVLAFALVAGDDLADLMSNTEVAFQMYLTTTGIGDVEPTPIAATSLVINPVVPNPFNPSTEISYVLPRDGRVNVGVFNTQGRRVATLVNDRQTAGAHHLTWRADGMASGVYFLRVAAGEEVRNTKMMLVK
jgi:hypothetical protein